MKCVVVANIAGGVGKTTTAHALAVAAAEYGKKVLLIDADPSGTLTFCCGIENPRVTTLEFISGTYSLDASAVKSAERFSLVPASSRLASIDINTALDYAAFTQVLKDYDLVVVDTATGPNRIMTYFLGIADLVLCPTTTEIISIRGVLHVKNFADALGKNNQFKVLISGGYEEENEALTHLRKDFSVLDPFIHRDEAVAHSQTSGRSVLSEFRNSLVAADYREITYSILEELSLM